MAIEDKNPTRAWAQMASIENKTYEQRVWLAREEASTEWDFDLPELASMSRHKELNRTHVMAVLSPIVYSVSKRLLEQHDKFLVTDRKTDGALSHTPCGQDDFLKVIHAVTDGALTSHTHTTFSRLLRAYVNIAYCIQCGDVTGAPLVTKTQNLPRGHLFLYDTDGTAFDEYGPKSWIMCLCYTCYTDTRCRICKTACSPEWTHHGFQDRLSTGVCGECTSTSLALLKRPRIQDVARRLSKPSVMADIVL